MFATGLTALGEGGRAGHARKTTEAAPGPRPRWPKITPRGAPQRRARESTDGKFYYRLEALGKQPEGSLEAEVSAPTSRKRAAFLTCDCFGSEAVISCSQWWWATCLCLDILAGDDVSCNPHQRAPGKGGVFWSSWQQLALEINEECH